jgi:PIN domain nuclease of toxin-antitoxin system
MAPRSRPQCRWPIDRALSGLHAWPITLEVARALERLDFRSDPADEIIAATSLVHRVPLLTRDPRILASRVVPLARREVLYTTRRQIAPCSLS